MGTCSEAICKHRILFLSMQRLAWLRQGRPHGKQKCGKNSDFLDLHVIVAGASPGETKMWAAVRRNGIARPPCISWASCTIIDKADFFRCRLQIQRTDGQWYRAEYSTFSISDEVGKYQLTVSGYSGDAGDPLTAAGMTQWIANGRQFTTLDNDNDAWSTDNCAAVFKGGWWHNDCSASMLNRDAVALWSTAAVYSVKTSRVLVKLY